MMGKVKSMIYRTWSLTNRAPRRWRRFKFRPGSSAGESGRWGCSTAWEKMMIKVTTWTTPHREEKRPQRYWGFRHPKWHFLRWHATSKGIEWPSCSHDDFCAICGRKPIWRTPFGLNLTRQRILREIRSFFCILRRDGSQAVDFWTDCHWRMSCGCPKWLGFSQRRSWVLRSLIPRR